MLPSPLTAAVFGILFSCRRFLTTGLPPPARPRQDFAAATAERPKQPARPPRRPTAPECRKCANFGQFASRRQTRRYKPRAGFGVGVGNLLQLVLVRQQPGFGAPSSGALVAGLLSIVSGFLPLPNSRRGRSRPENDVPPTGVGQRGGRPFYTPR